jgi:hypothetical protein
MSFLFSVTAIDPSGLESADGVWIRPICPKELYEELNILLLLGIK